MKPRRLTHPSGGARVNVTPMIDVVMVLIVFYLLVGQLAAGRRAAMDLPGSAVGAELGPGDPIVVNVVADGRVVIDRDEYGLGELPGLVRSRPPGTEVRLRADRSLGYGSVRPVIDALRAGGAETVRLSAKQETGG